MVAKAVRCQACRAKKIKCGQEWPQCLQCRRGKRKCSGPPERVKFVSVQTCSPRASQSRALANSKSSEPDGCASNLFDDDFDLWMVSEPELARANKHDSSDDFELMLSISNPPALQVASCLVHMASAKHSPFHLGSFVEHIPAMLPSSFALTATAACCVDACARNERLPRKSRTLDVALYGKALNAIQQALADPHERTDITTFLAVALMQRMETTFVTSKEIATIPCWSVHAGGVSELLKYRGVFDPNEDLVFNTVLENFGPIVSHSVFREEDCFLATAEWQPIFALRKNSSLAQTLLCIVFSQLAFFPGLLRGVRSFKRGEDAFSETIDGAVTVMSTLDWVGKRLEESILPDLPVRPANPIFIGTPVPEVYIVEDQDVLRLISWHASLSIMISNMFSSLLEPESNDAALSGMITRRFLWSTRIWMLSEEARQSGLVHSYFFAGAMTNTYESAGCEETRKWIVDFLSDLHGFEPNESPWTHESVQRACDKLAGRN